VTHTQDSQFTVPSPGTYAIDAGRSTVAFTTRHFFGLGAVRGTFALASGRVQVAAEATQSSATAVIDVDSFSTGSGARDKVVRSAKYLNSPAHPRITFVSTAVQVTDAGYLMRGDLTVKDTVRPIELAVEKPEHEAGGIRLRATTRIDRYAFGIVVDKGITGRHLDLSLDILAVPTAANITGE
jgi:polyisoprenoid-binding protein YceI